MAEQIRPGATVEEAIEMLDADPAYQLQGTDALRAWMQELADEAMADLAGSHFDIPEPVRTTRVHDRADRRGRHLLHRAQRGLQPSGPDVVGRAQGRSPSSAPGARLTTVYHEGVPGHHLQVAQTVYRSELLNRWRRLESAGSPGTARAGRCTPSG